MDQQFLFQAMVYLLAAVIMVPVAKKTGMGSVLGYLLAGIIIGPYVLKIIGEEGADIMHFAEFGVVMMLFVIGLELQPELLWKMRKSIIGLGGLQVIISAVCIAGIAIALGLNVRESIAIGLAFSLSSTAIVLQTLHEKGLMKSSGGQSAFSVLLFQDIAFIPMLALFPLLIINTPEANLSDTSHSTSPLAHLPGWGKTLVGVGAVGIIYLAGRFLVKPFFRIIARTRLRELFTATALLLVVSIAVLMSYVGLSAALGTFLAGVVLANSEYRHELESDIEPFKGLLLGLFFIAIGASIDFGLVIQNPLQVLGLVVGLMTVKGLILFAVGKIFKLKLDQNLLFANSLSQVGEFAFVLLSFSGQKNILSPQTIQMAMAIVAISMALTPVVVLLNEKLITPYLGTKEEVEEKEPDAIEEKNPVVIAGFGHFGNTVGRFLRAHGVESTLLDLDSDRVDLLRKMGFKVYYGDATRVDLLRSAGVAQAKLIIISIDDANKRLEMVETIKKHFSNVQIMVRAKDRYDAYDLMNAGMLHIYRETLDTSLRMGVDVLQMLGHRAYSAQRAARKFRQYDEQNIKKLAVYKDKEQYVVAAKALIEEMEELLQNDMQQLHIKTDEGWDEDTLIADANTDINTNAAS
jgi:monovalent cation:H+ antiporter-2, CPA2 family